MPPPPRPAGARRRGSGRSGPPPAREPACLARRPVRRRRAAARARPAGRAPAPPPGRRCPRGRVRRAATGRRRPACPSSSEPSSSARPRQRAPPIVPSASAWRTVNAAGPPRSRAAYSAWRSSAPSCPASCDAAPSTPSPTGAPCVEQVRTGAMPVPSRALELGQCATPVPVSPRRAISVGRAVDAVREPHVVAEQAETLGVLHGSAAVLALAVRRSSSSVSARCVCSRTPALRARATDSRIRSGVTENGEHGRDRDPQHRAGRGVVEAVDRLLGGGQGLVGLLDEVVRWQAARGGPRSIDPRAGMEPHAHRRAASIVAANRSPPPRGKT